MRFVTLMFAISFFYGFSLKADETEIFYKNNCINCHGPQGMGLASYPRIGGKDKSYLEDKLRTYRAGQKVGPNSYLMINKAKKLTDADIDMLSSYLASQVFTN